MRSRRWPVCRPRLIENAGCLRNIGQMTRHGRLRTKEELGIPKWMTAVEGSVDDPPIVMRQDRMKYSAWFLGGCSLLAFILLVPEVRYSTGTIVGLSFLGVLTAFFGLMAAIPATLVLDSEGLEWRLLFRTIRFGWDDFRGFYTDRSRGLIMHVNGDMSEAFVARSGRLGGLARKLDLGSFWELPAARVVEVLNEALVRWGTRS